MNVPLKIYKNKKEKFIVLSLGVVLFLIGCVFIYSDSILNDGFCKWTGVLATFLGVIIVILSISYGAFPVFIADSAGISFNITIIGKKIFIPWQGVQRFYSKRLHFPMMSIVEEWYLIIEIKPSFLERFPVVMKNVYHREGNKLLFLAKSLATPIQQIEDKLRSYVLML